MKKKFLKFASIALVTLFFPMISFAALDWGVGYDDSTGSFKVGVGSEGSGAGDVWGTGSAKIVGWSLSNPYGLPQGTILGILSNFLFWLLAIFGILGVIGFVISGILYLVAAGDGDTIERAKKAMTWSIVGILVGLSGIVVIQAVMMFLSGASNQF